MLAIIQAPDAAAIHREEQRKRDERDRQLEKTVTTKAAAAIERLASAIIFPRISADYLEGALKDVALALEAARELDR